ncbi:MAG TPA: nuclear transport factor 2 family protein [Candidatus Dormibacteraeota bacterium]
MPWVPELFSAPALQRVEEKRRHKLVTVPYFDGLMAGEFAALVDSFAGEPELHHPVRGRIRGARAFEAFIIETNAWLRQRNVSVEDVDRVVGEQDGFEEVVLHLDGEIGRVDLPVAVVADRQSDGRINELRMYFSGWALTGRHANRPPLLQPDPELRESDVVAEYQRALSAGDVDVVVAAFEPDGYAREPAGGQYIHRGHDGLRAFYERLFSNDGGIPLEPCALIDDKRACALEYNVVRWGKTELPPEAGVAVYVRGHSGKLAAARIYDDVNPPLGSHV